MSTRSPLRTAVAIFIGAALTFALLAPNPLEWLGLIPPHSREIVDGVISDKVQHAVAYAILTAALLAAIAGTRRRVAILAVSIALAHGIAAELLQRFVPDRTCDWRDIVADAAGILAALVLWHLRLHFLAARRERSFPAELPPG